MEKKKTGALSTAVVFLFLFLCVSAAACLIGYDRYNRLSDEIGRINRIPQAKTQPGEVWRNPNADIEYLLEYEAADNDYLHYYKYNNIEFISYSDNWDEAKLAELKDELLLNVHGPELDYLDRVMVYAEEDADALGYHDDSMRFYPVDIFMPGLLPGNLEYKFTGIASTIEIMGGDTYTEVSQLSRTLSHEYGHHFTFYYFFNDYKDYSDSEYYRLRNNPEYDIFYIWGSTSHYYEYHDWYLWELAADDYVYFFGSPNTRYTEDYMDDLEALKLDVKSHKKYKAYYESLSYDSFNLDPHLNVDIAMPDKVPGLQELFEDCLGLQLPDNPYDASDIGVDISKRYKEDYAHYEITWNKPWTDEDVLYTLVAYDENGEVYWGIKTINGSENAKAYIGKVVYSNYYWNTDLPDKLTFRVVVTFPEGFAAVSPAVEKEF